MGCREVAKPHSDDLIVIAGAGGFIGGWLVNYLHSSWYGKIRAVDIKPVSEWHQVNASVENLQLDLSKPTQCRRACENAVEVYNLAADMGGMGFIEKNRIACMRSVLINTNLIEAAYQAGVGSYFYASSACVYNTDLQQNEQGVALKESDAYPSQAERGYGWEKLYSEMLCQEYHAERGMRTQIARFHNVYGPNGTWKGGREKAPAAICRKVLEARDNGSHTIEIWGDGTQMRSFMYITDCVVGIDKIMHCDNLTAMPINLGSSELVTINQLVDIAEAVEPNVHPLLRVYDTDAPKGVAGRNSDNKLIKQILDWEPSMALKVGMHETYYWIKRKYKSGK